MTKSSHSMALALVAALIACPALASGPGAKSKPGEHFDFAKPKTEAEAREALRDHSSEMVIALTKGDPYGIHEESYYLEDATAFLREAGILGATEGLALANVIEAVHLASEDEDLAAIRKHMPDLLSRIDHVLIRPAGS
ncbi:MAG: hypothetical protein CMJ42_20505 [Phyllobacteriaceae bacterium]|nr:hypothetical protein [Phyllobacteriaceae bacterium]MBA90716.1 hypothetical protein [Phyllobacteriaceae bacterium]